MSSMGGVCVMLMEVKLFRSGVHGRPDDEAWGSRRHRSTNRLLGDGGCLARQVPRFPASTRLLRGYLIRPHSYLLTEVLTMPAHVTYDEGARVPAMRAGNTSKKCIIWYYERATQR